MANRVDNSSWKEYINKFSSYEGTVTDFCKENNISKSQFYYHKKRFKELDPPTFHAISLSEEKTELLISKMEKEIESKDKKINDLKNQLAFLQGQILNKNKNILGQSSEQVDSNQISLFDEAEKIVI